MAIRLLWIGCLSYLLIGFTHVIIGSVLPELLLLYGRSYSAGGDLVFAQFFGLLSGVLIMPWLIRRLGRRSSLMLAFSCMGAAELFITLLPPWYAVLIAAYTAGLGAGLIEASVGTLVLQAIKDRQAVAMSRLEVFFGLGALIMPFISGFLIAYGLWKYGFLLLGVSSVCTMLLWWRLSFGDEVNRYLVKKSADTASGDTVAGTNAGRGGKSSLPLLTAFIIVFFMYVGGEVCIIHFLPSVFIEKYGIASSASTISVTCYWAAMVVGRLFIGIAAEKAGYARFLLATCLGSALALAGLAISSQLWAAYALVLLIGLLMAGMFAIALVYANKLLPGSTERTTSLLIASGGLGGSVLPLMLGRLMDAYSAAASVWFMSLIMLLMFALVGAAWLAQNKQRAVSA